MTRGRQQNGLAAWCGASPPRFYFVVAALVGAFGPLGEARARANDATARAVRLDYDAPVDCPSSVELATSLRARSPRVVLTRDTAALGLVVHVWREGHRVRGRVVVRPADGPSSQREVEGASCSEVVDALSFIASVAADPAAALDAHSRAERPASPETPAEGAASARASDVDLASKAGEEMRPPPAPAPRETAALSVAVAASGGPRVAAGAQLGLANGLAPTLVLPWGVFVDVADASLAPLAGLLRVRVEHSQSGDVAAGEGTAAFALTTAGVDVCAIVGARRHARIAGCARLAGGVFYAAGRSVTPSRSALRPWLAFGPSIRGTVDLAGPLFFELEASARAHVVRDRFFLEPDRTLFRAAAVGFGVALGAGVTFR